MNHYAPMPNAGSDEPLRAAGRASISLWCEVRQGTRQWQRVLLEDLSPAGFRIAGLANPSTMATMSIRIPGIQLLSAQIRWVAGTMAGCEFVQPLHVAVFDHLVRQTRAI